MRPQPAIVAGPYPAQVRRHEGQLDVFQLGHPALGGCAELRPLQADWRILAQLLRRAAAEVGVPYHALHPLNLVGLYRRLRRDRPDDRGSRSRSRARLRWRRAVAPGRTAISTMTGSRIFSPSQVHYIGALHEQLFLAITSVFQSWNAERAGWLALGRERIELRDAAALRRVATGEPMPM